jgi:hypothetical protein
MVMRHPLIPNEITRAPGLWTPLPIWKDQDAFLIGGGPSLTGFNFSGLKGRNVIGCNDACFLGFPPLSYCVFGDAGWWQRNREAIQKMPGPFVSNAPSIQHCNLPNVLKVGRWRDGLQTGNVLGWNYSTGALAMNLAVSLGASRIFLLGYDLRNQDKKSHWHKRNPNLTKDSSFAKFSRGFNRIAEDLKALYPSISVFNVSDGTSQLKFWTIISFAELEEMIRPLPLLDSPLKEVECVS